MYKSNRITNNITKKEFRVFVFIITAILLAKLFLMCYLPMPNSDGPWALSHTFSIIRGHFFKSSFAHAFMGFYNLPYMYGLLNTPFYAAFTNTGLLVYSIFILNTIWIALTLIMSFYLLRRSGDNGLRFILFAFAFLLSTYTYSLRPEIFIMPLLITMLWLLEKFTEQNKLPWPAPVLAAVVGLVHPVGGFYAVFFLIVYCLEKKLGLKKLFLLLCITGLSVFILYGPVILKDITLWKLNFFQRGFENDIRHFDLTYPVKFYVYSLPFFGLTIFYIFSAGKENWIREIGYVLCCILIFLLFKRSYYFPYLFHFALWRLTIKREYNLGIAMKYSYTVAVLGGLFLCLGLPLFQQIENMQYRATFKDDLQFARSFAEENKDKLVWVPASLAMSVIDKPNGRLYFPTNENLSGVRATLDSNSVYLLQSKYDLPVVRAYKIDAADSLVVRQVYAPVKGLMRLGINGERSDSIGLWMVTAAKKYNQ